MRPTLFAKTFQAALVLAQGEGGSWRNYTTKVAISGNMRGQITALIASAAPKLESTVVIREVREDGEDRQAWARLVDDS